MQVTEPEENKAIDKAGLLCIHRRKEIAWFFFCLYILKLSHRSPKLASDLL